jgi:hypothetical protein
MVIQWIAFNNVAVVVVVAVCVSMCIWQTDRKTERNWRRCAQVRASPAVVVTEWMCEILRFLWQLLHGKRSEGQSVHPLTHTYVNWMSTWAMYYTNYKIFNLCLYLASSSFSQLLKTKWETDLALDKKNKTYWAIVHLFS